MATWLLDPSTQAVLFVAVLCALGLAAFDLVAEMRDPSPAERFRAPRFRWARPAEAPRRRAEAGPAVEFWSGPDGVIGGQVRAGPCRSRRLDGLTREECAAQLRYLRDRDAAAAATLESYIERRFAAAPPPPREEGGMSRAQALRELGLSEGASAGEIHAAWVKAIKRHHPDHGGSHAKAARINAAKEVLEG